MLMRRTSCVFIVGEREWSIRNAELQLDAVAGSVDCACWRIFSMALRLCSAWDTDTRISERLYRRDSTAKVNSCNQESFGRTQVQRGDRGSPRHLPGDGEAALGVQQGVAVSGDGGRGKKLRESVS